MLVDLGRFIIANTCFELLPLIQKKSIQCSGYFFVCVFVPHISMELRGQAVIVVHTNLYRRCKGMLSLAHDFKNFTEKLLTDYLS